ncbi:kinesin-like protein CG14535 isoform X2 [Phlebotomus papatasi]|uniref:kinesin-like protein CG14535 isoform X2 n=1 Tax=Phlebotomus papatasi TaxID=29031 RepID=UPI0024836D61|nr:kinesin-like protein CG14535 isoform X2 [Phlebotomus papatasi]XP_055710123.1 kinesin-like protein CG14535 isoform X2 [Phlebotomus papatasi]XP_055710124.1 kinesin-like protein CG14535 isoform X2 [Phlebotomus papatasi]XP_055710126.1 kinesin-like protein CG14535 isoform X2 [Phlebotomus papatasi]
MSTTKRMAQGHKVSSSGQGLHKNSRATEILNSSDRGGFCGALQRTPPPMPAAISRRLANRENAGIGKVKVMLRIADNPVTSDEGASSSFLTVDKKKRQVTLSDPSQASLAAASHPSGSQERGPMVAAPKMFAFDGLFTPDDSQSDLSSAALSEVIPAVLDGSDGCLLALGYPGAGQSKSMMGSINGAGDLGAIPCAISWLYRGINERRQKSGARFSVRVSALGVNATKPGSTSRDLLAAHATESDESPGVYLRDDFLGGPTELRAPTAERAALFLDTALAGRATGHNSPLEPALIFTLHVYQYSLAGKGGVAGGRSRLHLVDLGGCANRAGGLPLSGIGNVLLAILSGQRHPPNRDHPLTPLLKDCLAPITCHVTVLAHVTHSQSHSDALTTIQLASRIHRMRRRKHRFQLSGADKGISLGSSATGHQSGGSSEGPDPSSSDLSADTVIYMGPCDDQTDGEHPPVYLPSLSSGDNRCAMQKVLKGTTAEKPNKSPAKKVASKQEFPQSYQQPNMASGVASQNTLVTAQRTDSLKRNYDPGYQNTTMSPVKQKIPTSPYKYPMSLNKASNVPTPKGSPLRRPNMVNSPHDSPVRKITEEKWIDGPRVSRSKVAEARHLMREINHVKQCETWVDGPKTASQNTSKTLVAGCLPGSLNPNGAYGFMDSHKKSMIRQWVENQTSQMLSSGHQLAVSSPSSPHHQKPTYHMTQFKCSRSEDDQRSAIVHDSGAKREEENHSEHTANTCPQPTTTTANENQEEEDQDSGPSEVPPALPLIDRLGSREISHESLHLGSSCSRHISRENLPGVQMMDCGLQVTEEEIARTMGSGIGADHPLSALSHGDMSIVSSFHVGDTFSDCVIGDNSRHQFDQLARLREIFTSQLAMAEVTPVFRVGGDAGSVYSEPAYRFNGGTGSVCSEPVCRAPSPRCRDCRQSITLSRSPSQTSLPSLNGIVAIAGMEQYASLRHPDGASDPNLQKIAQLDLEDNKPPPSPAIEEDCGKMLADTPLLSQTQLPQLPPLPLSTSEAYDSGHDSTPRTSKHSGISRRAESGYHSVATVRDSDESSFSSAAGSKVPPREPQKIHAKKSKRNDKSLCHWLRSPFTCTYPDTEGEVSDF